MPYQLAPPSTLLSPFVKQYWSIENCLQPSEKSTMRIVPSGMPELTFYFSAQPRVMQPAKAYPGNYFITGQQNHFHDIEISGKLQMFSVTFHPHATAILFNVPARHLYNQNIPLDLFINRSTANEFYQKLAETPGFRSRVEITEQIILRLLKDNHSEYTCRRMNDSISHIKRSRGLVDIDDLASKACLSRKQYERTFSAFVGTTPKQFLKIIRFQHAIFRKQTSNDSNLTTLAYDCGYFDQAHMINDFKQLSGLTPKQYFADCEPHSDYFS